MRPFEYIRAADPAQAVAMVAVDPAADYLAGGTTQVDLMLKDGIVSPERLVDITRLPLRWITANATAIRVGATTTMEELAADPTVSERLSFVRDALLDEYRAGDASAATADVRFRPAQLSDDEIRERMSGNICRCGAYSNIVEAITEVVRSPA